MILIADANVPWPVTSQWVLGMLGCLAAYYLIVVSANASRKLFGRRPPMDEQLKEMDMNLRKAIVAGDAVLQSQINQINEARVEHHAQIERMVGTIGKKLDETKSELLTDGQRRTDALTTISQKFTAAIAKLDERTNPKSGAVI